MVLLCHLSKVTAPLVTAQAGLFSADSLLCFWRLLALWPVVQRLFEMGRTCMVLPKLWRWAGPPITQGATLLLF